MDENKPGMRLITGLNLHDTNGRVSGHPNWNLLFETAKYVRSILEKNDRRT